MEENSFSEINISLKSCKIFIKTLFFSGNVVLKAQSSINILEFGSFQLRKRAFFHFLKMEEGISPSFKTVVLFKTTKSQFPISFQVSEKVRIFQWGKATVTRTKFPSPHRSRKISQFSCPELVTILVKVQHLRVQE